MRSLRSTALMLGTVLAMPLAAETAPPLTGATGEELLKAAYATCLLLGAAGNAATEAFVAAGWEAVTNDEAGYSGLTGPDETYAMTWTDGGYCLVQSETIGTDRAGELLAEVIAATGKTAVDLTGEDGCLSFALAGGGPGAEVTSSGNDPVCRSADNSGVSFMWAQSE
ncbi:hypothetical protein [Pseudogemmobacter bohemicus]|uniref:hypothetical protein n=1 Tax=Pseudogemmobacter bohemicus TaxID=2250708 RepID=UPI0013006145|nr:hypothetical protein [Pseudogemmobacter bohemicus]